MLCIWSEQRDLFAFSTLTLKGCPIGHCLGTFSAFLRPPVPAAEPTPLVGSTPADTIKKAGLKACFFIGRNSGI